MPRNWRTELIGGITTFFTMAYIVIVNPSILSTTGTGMPFEGVLTATVLVCFLMTMLMGLYAKLPFAVAPGMGINAFFTYSLILGEKIPWPVALGMVFWAGILFLILSFGSVRENIAQAIPNNLRLACAAGIGLFLTFIGLKNSGLVVANPATFVSLGKIGQEQLFCLFGLIVTLFFHKKKNPLAFLIGIFSVTTAGWLTGAVNSPETVFSAPDFHSVFFKADILGALKLSFLPAIISILFTDLFDSISTFVGVSYGAGMLDKKGDPKNLREGLIVDAWATLTAGLFGTSSGTAYIESSAGIEAGGRTGWTAIFCALCFLPCFFLGPLVSIVPTYATAPVLILVGSFLFRSVKELELQKIEDLIPSFLAIALIPLTFSITQGIVWGFLSHVILYWMAGRRKEITTMLYVVFIVCLLLLFI